MIHTEFGHSITFISQNWNSNPNFVAPLDKIGEIYSEPNKPIYKQRHIDKNTWESWGLVPESRPTLPHPSQKTKTEDCESINGIIDLSWSNTPYPLFSNREGSFTFIYNPIVQMGYDKYKPWNILYSEFLHGRKLRMVLEDDPEYYYEGRFWVESWDSGNDGSGSTITIGYSVDPYKMSILSSLNDWLWDPFNFYNGVIQSSIFNNIVLNSTKNQITNKEYYSDIIRPASDDIPSAYRISYINSHWQPIDETKHEAVPYDPQQSNVNVKYLNLFGLVGTKPQIPLIHWHPNDTDGNGAQLSNNKKRLIVNYVNFTYGIDYGKSGIRYKYFDPFDKSSSRGVTLIKSATTSNPYYTFKDNDMIFCDAYGGEYQFIQFIGNGTVKIEFRRGMI